MKTIAIIQHGIDEGLHIGAQVYVWHDGHVIFDDGIGDASPGVAMSRETINAWFSSVKPVMPVALAQLRDAGKLSFDDTIAKYIPEFGVGGKESITIRHCLTHTAGFRAWPNVELSAPWDEIVAKICASRIEPRWTPGEKAGYHPRTAWFILAEVLRRTDGRMYDVYAREEIFLPLGMADAWLRTPADVFEKYERDKRIAVMQDRTKSPPTPGVLTATEAAELHPGASGRGPIISLGIFYRALLDGSQILSAHSVNELIRPQRVGMYDNTFKHRVDMGLGFIVNLQDGDVSALPYGYGKYASRQTFGHSGAQSSSCFCDPVNRLIVCWVCNGMPGDERHQQRQFAINNAIYEDLAITK